jgi:D-sedoheptulose 7-phosphate isomerase
MNQYMQYANELKQTLDHLAWGTLEKIVARIHQARVEGKQLFIMGNGGSAATASHLACDLAKNINTSSYSRLRVMALTDNMPLFSAAANDLGYENVFSEQLANWLQPNDLVLAISASGNSPNVLKAIKFAQSRKATTIGWSGYDGGKLADLADISFIVPNYSIEQIEDIHMMMAHMVTSGLRQISSEKIIANGYQPKSELNGHATIIEYQSLTTN